MIPVSKIRIASARSAFSLFEMAAVIAILVILMTVGVSLLNGTGVQSRKAGTDMLTGVIEQARTLAITSHSPVVLAIAEPGDLPAGDERCRIGLFKVDSEWPDPTNTPVPLECTLLNRWKTLNSGVVLIPGDVDGVANPLELPEIDIIYGGPKKLKAKVHLVAFNSRGGLHFPAGSTPIVFRLAEGSYRGGKATPNQRAAQKTISENRLKIGRVTARPYQIDG